MFKRLQNIIKLHAFLKDFWKTLISNARLRFDQNNNNPWYQKEL